ncbi:MAG: hypothetical protein EZS28_035218 [Streblomastix strix]|uniref:SH3 domain-containing protein n=1 Tax=Streblomastix strix TaxID=222440 RepID=A0A5J4UER1_9EUKA|nr:MAG: hypothetical protein EZS28_035218 [Streblomastix strix]
MQSGEEQLEAQFDYAGQEGDAGHYPISKGDIVRVINKGIDFCIVEKDGKVGKVPYTVFKCTTSESVRESENMIQTTSTSQITTQISNHDSVIPNKIGLKQ